MPPADLLNQGIAKVVFLWLEAGRKEYAFSMGGYIKISKINIDVVSTLNL